MHSRRTIGALATVYATHRCTDAKRVAHNHITPLERLILKSQGVHPWVLCWLVFWLIHLDVFVPISLITKRNVNYVLVPPPIKLLRNFSGQWYRPAVGFITGCLTVLMFTITKAIVALANLRRHDVAGQGAKRLSLLQPGESSGADVGESEPVVFAGAGDASSAEAAAAPALRSRRIGAQRRAA